MVVEVGHYGAFSVNRVGLEGKPPFPLSFSVREADGSWIVRGSAAQAAELADVLMRAASGTVVVVDLCTNSFLDENYVQWRPSRIAAEQGVSWQARPIGALTSGAAGLSEEVLAIRPDDLPRFLAGWSPYELTLVDMPGQPTAERLDEIALAIGTAAHGEPVLPGLPGSRLLYSGHDDCYLTVESADPSVPAALLSRLLALLAGSALAGASPAEVPEPVDALVMSLIGDNAYWTGMLGSVSENTVTVSLTATAEPWRLGQKLPERIDRLAICDMRHGSWRLATAHGC
jgi:hypothetical protein